MFRCSKAAVKDWEGRAIRPSCALAHGRSDSSPPGEAGEGEEVAGTAGNGFRPAPAAEGLVAFVCYKLLQRLGCKLSAEVLSQAPHDAWTESCLTTAWHRLARQSQCISKSGLPMLSPCISVLQLAQLRIGFASLPPRGIACTVWAWGKLKHKDLDCLNGMVQAIPLKVHDFTTRDVSNVLYGFGLLRHRPVRVALMLIDTLPPRMLDCSSQTLANTAYALALLNFKSESFWRALAEHAPQRAHHFKAQELAILLYSCGLIRARHDELLQASCENARLRLHEFSPQNISNMVYALGLLRFVDASFLEAWSPRFFQGFGCLSEASLPRLAKASLRALSTASRKHRLRPQPTLQGPICCTALSHAICEY
eukprot:s3647_g7.t2